MSFFSGQKSFGGFAAPDPLSHSTVMRRYATPAETPTTTSGFDDIMSPFDTDSSSVFDNISAAATSTSPTSSMASSSSAASSSSSVPASVPITRASVTTISASQPTGGGGPIAGSIASVEGTTASLATWDPVAWNRDCLPNAQIYLSWSATLKQFSESTVMADRTIDRKTLHLEGDEYVKAFARTPSAFQYLPPTLQCMCVARQIEKKISVITIDVITSDSTLPFPIGIRCSEDLFNQVSVPGVGKVMFVIPAHHKDSKIQEKVVDMRTSMSSDRMRMVMSINMKEVSESWEPVGREHGGRQPLAELRDHSILHKMIHILSDALSRDPDMVKLKGICIMLLNEIEKSSPVPRPDADSPKDRSRDTNWHTNLNFQSIESVVKYMENQSKKCPRPSELKFTLVPIHAYWIDPSSWEWEAGQFAGLDPRLGSSSTERRARVFEDYMHRINTQLKFVYL